MHPLFATAVENLHPKFEQLLASPALTARDPKPRQGIYLFTEAGQHLYVGRSNNIPARFKGHTGLSAQHQSAAFAMLIARQETGREATYRADDGTRAALMLDATFRPAFDAAKARIQAMEFRCVEEIDQTRQTLLEVYVAVVLQTPFNDFGTH